jgi:hypothetical protein
MKLWSVQVRRTLVEATYVEVEAENDEEAGDKALELFDRQPPRSFSWDTQDEDLEVGEVEEA